MRQLEKVAGQLMSELIVVSITITCKKNGNSAQPASYEVAHGIRSPRP